MPRARWLRSGLFAMITSAVVLAGSGTGSAAVSSDSGARGPGSVLWTSVRAGDGDAIAADPRGGMVFAVGSAFLVAYDAATGTRLWSNGEGAGQYAAVSPNGRIVFVISSVSARGGADFRTSAFDAATGRRLWARRYNGPANGVDRPVALAVGPGGGKVFVTGYSQGKTSAQDYATVAYAAGSGRQVWVRRYNGHGRSRDIPAAIAVSRRGAVFVTGVSFGSRIGSRFATVAYAARDGARLWTRRYHGKAYANDYPVVVLESPRFGGTVIVAGGITGRPVDDYLAVAYSAGTGHTKWVRRFRRRGFSKEYLGGAAISPNGRSLYLAGFGYIVPGGEEPGHSLTIAAKVATGAQTWSRVITTDEPSQVGGPVAVSPDGRTVYIGVEDFTSTAAHDFTTVAYRT